ncbi:MAG: hypothetical protein ACLFWZ_07530 [Coleofasciculus sp.]
MSDQNKHNMSSELATNKSKSTRKNIGLIRFTSILALGNLILVLFHLSYIPLRNLYLKTFPELTEVYDPVVGIEPHPETENYLNTVNELEEQVVQTGLQSPQTEELLEELRLLSERIIEENPFEGADKISILEKIKNEIRLRVGEEYARDAFATFWSKAYLSQAGWQEEIAFFQREIKPLFKRNYYREIGQFGYFVDYFWRIDLPFIIIFALEILVRSYSTSRRKPQLNWREAILRRWYDFFLVLPFWRWLRVIPVTIRLYQAGLLNLESVRKQLNYDFAVSFAEQIIEMIGVQVIDQLQESIQSGELEHWLFYPESHRHYIEVNEVNEVKAITTRLVDISIYDVLPQIQPDIEALVHHSLENTLSQSSVYQQIENVPGLSHLPRQFTEKLAKDVSQTAYQNLVNTLEDPVGAELTARLTRNFRDAWDTELQKKQNREKLESLLVDMLEEVKINYVKRIAEGGVEKLSEKADKVEEIIRQK